MNRKSVLALLVFALIGVFLIVGCDGGSSSGNSDDTSETGDPGDTGGEGDDDTDIAELTDRTVYVNPDDAILYSYTSEDGEQFTYYGRRDEEGIPTLITSVEYVDAVGDSNFIYYDQNGLPAKLIADDGTTLEFDYSLEEADGATIELSDYPTASAMELTNYPIAMAITEIGVTVTVPEEDGPKVTSAIVPLGEEVLVAPDPIIKERFNEEMFGNIMIIIDQCGEPVRPDGEVWVNFQPLSYQGIKRHYPALPMSYPGYYMSRIPQATEGTVTPEDAENMCKSFADALSTACSVFDPKVVGPQQAALMTNPAVQTAICGEVAVAMSLAATPAAGAVAGGACAVLLTGGTIACNTLGKSPPGFNQSNYMDTLLCSQLEETLENFNSATGFNKASVQAVADFSNSSVPSMSTPGDDRWVHTSPVQEVSTYEAYPNLYISASEPTIDNISTFPGAPRSGEEYTITAEFSCAFGMDLMISVTRDGLPQAYEKRYGDKADKTVTLDVSGSPTGKTDVIVVSVADTFSTDAPLRKEITVNFEEASVNESFSADADIAGVNVTFRPTNQIATKTLYVTQQEAVGLIASEGSDQNDEYISITINPNVVNRTGNYRFSEDIYATAGIFLFATPNLKHANVGPYANTNVQFTAHNGYIEFTSWGTNLGDIISGDFAVQLSGVQITGTDSTGGYTSRTHNGAIIGSFNLEVIPSDRNF